MKISRWLLCVTLLLTGHKVNAQAACPPGMIPYSTGSDNSACGPDDSQQQAPARQQLPPRQRWEDRWGAIATDGPGGSFGASTNMLSRNSAENRALVECHSKKMNVCSIELWYRDACAAMVIGDNRHTSNYAPTESEAVQIGMQKCNAVDTNCHVYYSACSLPQRIQ